MANRYKPKTNQTDILPIKIHGDNSNRYSLLLEGHGPNVFRLDLHFTASKKGLYATPYNLVEQTVRGNFGILPDHKSNTAITISPYGSLVLYRNEASTEELSFNGRELTYEVLRKGSLVIPFATIHSRIEAYKKARGSIRDLKLAKERYRMSLHNNQGLEHTLETKGESELEDFLDLSLNEVK